MDKCYNSSDGNDSEESQKCNSDFTPEVKKKRPPGRPRIHPKPLNAAKRRELKAQCERERRQQTAEEMRSLADAAGLDHKLNQETLLSAVICQLKRVRTDPPEDINELRAINQILTNQIADVESRLTDEMSLDAETEATSDSCARHIPYFPRPQWTRTEQMPLTP